MFDVKKYWEARYALGLNSGSGSYGLLAEFKADVLNTFVQEHEIKSVIEFGCGDGNQLSLANYPFYKGFDISETAVELCKDKFKNDLSKYFSTVYQDEKAELVISLDVLFHIIDIDEWKNYIKQLFSASTKYVIIYSCNHTYDHKVKWAAHFLPRTFTDYCWRQFPDWTAKEIIYNKYPYDELNPTETSLSNFYIYEKNA